MDQSPEKQDKIESQILNANAGLPSGCLGWLFSPFKWIFSRPARPDHFDTLHWRDIVEWFSNWLEAPQNKSIRENTIGFTIQETAKDGNYALVQGIFNKSTNKVEEVRRIQADEVDDEVKEQCFGKEKVTLFT